MNRNVIVIAAAALGLVSCASSLTVKEISNQTPAGAKVDGIPFRVPRTYIVTLYKLQSSGGSAAGAYAIAKSAAPVTETIPDMNHLYVLDFQGQPLSNPTVNLTLNPDNTIQTVSLSSSPSGQAALTALGAQLTAVGGAVAANQTAKNTAQTAYAASVSAYYTAMQAYCTASKAQPVNADAVRTAAAGVYASEIALIQAHDAAKSSDPPPYQRLINPQTDVGFGCPT